MYGKNIGAIGSFLLTPALCALFLGSFLTATSASDYSRKQVLADIDQIVGKLKKHHPNLYAHRKPKAFRRIVNEVRKSTKETNSRIDAAIQFQRILSAVCDEHTSVRFDYKVEPAAYRDTRFPNSGLLLRGDRAILESRRTAKFSEVLQFGKGNHPESISRFLLPLQSKDGCKNADNHFIQANDGLSMLALANLFAKDKENIELKIQSTPPNKVINFLSFVELRGFGKNLYDNDAFERESLVARLLRNGFRMVAEFTSTKHAITGYQNDKSGITYIKLDTFLGKKDWQKHLNKTMHRIIEQRPKHIIIDLMENKGGAIRNAGFLSSYFLTKAHKPARYARSRSKIGKLGEDTHWKSTESQKIHVRMVKQFKRARPRNGQRRLNYRLNSYGNPSYNGNITIMVGPETHSAAIITARILKTRGKSRIVGFLNEPNVKTYCAQPEASHRLSNTRILVNIPYFCFDTNYKRVLKPDDVVDPMVAPAFMYHANVLEAAFNEIK